MQTFLPYADFAASAAALDDRRLGKQRVETLQILRALVYPSYRGWRNHPATRMWRGFIPALVGYGVAVCDEWTLRGRADAVRDSLLEFTGGGVPEVAQLDRAGRLPPWLGGVEFHRSHRSALRRKDPEHYEPRFRGEPPVDDYVWPATPFPRWPLPAGPIPTDEAARLVDGAASERVRGALVAAMTSPARTLWVHRRHHQDRPAPAVSRLRPPRMITRPARTTPSVARPPTAEDLESVRAHIDGNVLDIGFVTVDRLREPTLLRGAGLVVAEAGLRLPPVAVPVLRVSAG